MKSLLLTAPYHLEWIEESIRNLKSDEILIKTLASAISIGSELPQYEGKARLGYTKPYPMMTGYENVGEVVEVGDAVSHVKVGQRVIGFYGYRTHAIIRAEAAIIVDEDITDKQALLAILSCDVAKGIRKLRPYPEESLLITGCGAIGLLTTFMLSAYGVSNISVVDPLEARRQLALELGARFSFSPVEIAQQENMYDLGIECSSSQNAFELLQAKMINNGRLTILADGLKEPMTLTPDFHRKELTLYASGDGWDYARHATWFFEVIRSTHKPLEKLFDVTISPQEIPVAFSELSKQKISAVKVFITGF